MMKRIIFILLSLSLITFSAFSQDMVDKDQREKFAFGLKVGTNYSSIYDSEGEDFRYDGKFGMAAGGFISIPLGIYIGIQPEVLFSQKGFNGSGGSSAGLISTNYSITRTTNYIDVPVFFALKPTPGFTLLAGPQFSYLLKQKDVFTNDATTSAQEQEFENDDLRKNTMAFVGGFDVNLSHLVLSGRAGWDFQNNRADGSSTTPRYKNVWVQGTIGFRLY